MTSTNQGLITVACQSDVADTVARLRRAITAADLRLFEHIDHAANARETAIALRPMQLIVFGHPRAGTVLMADRPSAGLDLPMRALVWEDRRGVTRLTYNDATWIARRHRTTAMVRPTVTAIADGMANLAATAACLDEESTHEP